MEPPRPGNRDVDRNDQNIPFIGPAMSGCVGALSSFGPQTHTHACSGFLFAHMKKLCIPLWIYKMSLTWPEKNVLGLIVSMREGFFGSNGYIASVFSITDENARYLVHSLSKQGVIEKLKRADGKRLLVPSAETARFSEDPDLLALQTSFVGITNGHVSNANKTETILYIDSKDKEIVSVSKVDTKGIFDPTKNTFSSKRGIIRKKEDKVTPVCNTNKLSRGHLLALRDTLRDKGVFFKPDELQTALEFADLRVSMNQYGKFDGIDKTAFILKKVQDGAYDPAKHPARSQRDSQTSIQV